MAYLIKKLSMRFILPLLFSLLAAVPSGCAPKAHPRPAVQETEQAAPAPVLITGISAMEDASGASVLITASGSLTYTSVKQSDPIGVVLYFPESALGNVQAVQTPDSELISRIDASELTTDNKTVRIKIALNHDSTYTVNRTEGGLKISFPNTSAAESAAGPAPPAEMTAVKTPESAPVQPAVSREEAIKAKPATMLSAVSTKSEDDHAVVYVQANGTIQDYASFTLPNPPRIVYDLKNLKSPYSSEQTIASDNPWLKRVRYYTHPDKVRLVLETTGPELSAYTARPTNTGLTIEVGGDARTAFSKTPVSPMATPDPAAENPVSTSVASPAGWVNRIDFTSEKNGKSTILIGTTAPAEYTLEKSEDTLLRLTLFHTKLPEYRERPLITTRFESAVDRIMPYRQAGTPDNAFFTIKLRESVPYHVEQKGDLILVHFEASSVPPKPLEERTLPAWQAALEKTQAVGNSVPAAPKASIAATETPKRPSEMSAPKELPNQASMMDAQEAQPNYTGEKITLDFYETDIKNVFRILKEVSGMNFAIDKDVTGKVTLSFDEPVPWDQVLDLILKMNQLGKVMEGNIVRIATLDTLKKEESERQLALLASQKTKEQELALEPLRTEYIAVNYSNAETEVLPHIKSILSEGRGKAEVDKRNNLIVITDTDRVIAQAKAIVQRLDKVTPQVMIEARVVEVNSDISNEIGIDWSAKGGPVSSGKLGGTYSWDVAMNLPSASTSGVGFQFARVSGTPLVIDAQLNALQTQSKGKILSAPKIVTLDNKKASIKQGVQVGYYERDDSGGSSTKFKDVDLLLEVTPHVTPDNRVSMTVYITKNDISGTFNNAPLLSTNEAKTEFLVNDGETIVIGGILKKTETVGEEGVPLLKDIPGLGWMFNKKNKEDVSQELLIFITPKIVTLSQKPVE